ncbi:MAG: hypothetical protein VX642_04575 [Bdellovibrionota bacterium]|nr:hypothetical protein [Bdellovibrionota bacterium]
MKTFLKYILLLLASSWALCAEMQENDELMVRLINEKAYSYSHAKLSLIQLNRYVQNCKNTSESTLKRLYYCYKESEYLSGLIAGEQFLSARMKLLEQEIARSKSLSDIGELKEILGLNPKIKNKIELRLRELQYIRSE